MVDFPKSKTLSRSTKNSAVTNCSCEKHLKWTQLHLPHCFYEDNGLVCRNKLPAMVAGVTKRFSGSHLSSTCSWLCQWLTFRDVWHIVRTRDVWVSVTSTVTAQQMLKSWLKHTVCWAGLYPVFFFRALNLTYFMDLIKFSADADFICDRSVVYRYKTQLACIENRML